MNSTWIISPTWSAVLANVCFAFGSIVYANYAKKISPQWMNATKASFALIYTFLFISTFDQWHGVSREGLMSFLLSGFIGLNIGDLFLFMAFSQMGAPRTLILFGLQPILITFLSSFFLGQKPTTQSLLGIFFFMLCLATFSLENFKKYGRWEFRGIIAALIGIAFDACGVVLTRYGFDHSPALTSFEGNFYRLIGALLGFIVLSYLIPIPQFKLNFFRGFREMQKQERALLALTCFVGTFLSLGLYLYALKSAHLATIAGISITGPLFASVFECIYLKRLPSKYFLLALIFFGLGIFSIT